ncbi:helicase associated domain-containing protein [Arthrobacter sp. U41]|uniref:helicase associated domain-containing protein n=1 Tax=Arthrobacter sp. U41 TaxID=1849032 RepID=UPI0037BEECAB
MLANWLSIRRRAARAGDLNEAERQLLAVLPGWEDSPRSRSDAERWNRRLEELRAFRASEGRWPQFRRPVPESERVLGVWLHAQRQTFGAGQLQTEALSQLDSTVPGWNAWRVKKLNDGSGDAAVMPVQQDAFVVGDPPTGTGPAASGPTAASRDRTTVAPARVPGQRRHPGR